MDSSPSRRSPLVCQGAPVMGPLPHPAFNGIPYSREEPLILGCTYRVTPFNRLLSSLLSRSFTALIEIAFVFQSSVHEVRRLLRCLSPRLGT